MGSGTSRRGRAAATIARLLAFAALFIALLVPLQLAASAFGGDPLLNASFAGAIAATVAGVVLLRWLERRPAGALGVAWTERTGHEIGVGLAVGAGAMALVGGVLAGAGMLGFVREAGTASGWAQTVVVDFGIFAIAAYAEEALFRGYPFQVLVRATGAVPAMLLASGAFAFAHAANPNVGAFALLNIFVAGILLSVAYLRTLSLWFATAVHLGWNWTMASLLDLPVSGITLFETPLYEPVVRGPEWLTGGTFGPEAGVVGTLAFVAALVATLKLKVIRPAPSMRALGPLVEESWPKQ